MIQIALISTLSLIAIIVLFDLIGVIRHGSRNKGNQIIFLVSLEVVIIFLISLIK